MKPEPHYPPFFARFYDVIYHQMRDSTDHNYFMKKILDTNGPVLEIGTGTGRFFIDALNKGADIYGIDFSPAMIEVLLSKLQPEHHHRVNVQDIRTMDPGHKYDLIIAPFRVFMHLIEIDDQLAALKRVHQFLQEGGTFIFDLFVPDLKILDQGLDNMMDFEGEYEPGMKIRRYTFMHADLIRQLSNITFTIEWEEHDGKVCREKWQTYIRFYFRYELELLLQLSEFSKWSVYGDFNENPLKEDSREFVIVCKK